MKALDLFRRFVARWRGGGMSWLCSALADRLAPARPAVRAAVLAATAGKRGLEIGGPSRIFTARGILPVYPVAACIDNVNFAAATAWETALRDGGEFRYHPARSAGTQWLREAVALRDLPDADHDFVLSSHCLEHVANPLAALAEWRRVTRVDGQLILVLPDPTKTFDHRRPVTTLDHLRADRARATPEDDSTHFAEVLASHDLARDPAAGTAEEFRNRTLNNARERCVHHHVFDLSLMSDALRETGWAVQAAEKVRPMHLIAFARKAAS